MLQLSDQDLLSRLQNFEDYFVERKTSSDKRDWLKTAVGFANSAPVGYPAVLFIGVRDDGTIEGTANLDKLQQTFSGIVSEAYPPIATFPKVLERDGKQFLAVIIPGSANRPHFAGQSYVRVGSATKEASEEQFAKLIAERNSKAREILNWKGKSITVYFHERTALAGVYGSGQVSEDFVVVDCDQFYVTVQHSANKDSVPLRRIEISFDYQANRLRLEVHPA